MMTEATMTVKGQVTVPREIRNRLGLKSGDKVAFTLLSDGTVVVRPKTRRLADLAGFLTQPGQPLVPIAAMNPFTFSP
jgi:AbrB family looped-hinge helix DNA binding protein